ncbi:MAG: PIN domain-containing protein [Pelistega sp.]|nr:PIN domain-containing protein [Pelistega sp.]
MTPSLITLDTCVLMHTFTRNLLLRLPQAGICSPIWSNEIGREWLRNAPRIWKVERDIVVAAWEAMQKTHPTANLGDIEVDEILFKKIDKKDRHIAACAWIGQQQHAQQESILLTWNTKDFHKKTLRDLGIALKTPEQYLSELWSHHQDLLISLFEQGREEHLALGLPDYSMEELLKRDKLFRVAKLYLATLTK